MIFSNTLKKNQNIPINQQTTDAEENQLDKVEEHSVEHEENSEATLRENSESKPINQTKEEE